MKKRGSLLILLAAFVSAQAYGQDRLEKLTFEECNTASFFENISNGTTVLQYVSAGGAVLNIGDSLILSTPSGSRATGGVSSSGGSSTSGNVTVGASVSSTRTNIRSQYATILMGRPAGLGNVVGALGGSSSNYASGDMQGEIVVIAEMSVRHDGGRKKPLELVVLLGEPNGRAFGINKYMSAPDYEASVTQGELKPVNAPLTRDEAIAKLKEAKDLFDLGLLGEAEYNKTRDELSPIILGK